MTQDEQQARMARANQMADGLKAETARGQACVGDALLDELFKELFRKRLVGKKADVGDVLKHGQILGSHGGRLRLAHLLGWIGAETYRECRVIHKGRNRMAHDLDVDTFDHPEVRNLVDSLLTPRALTVTVKGKVRKVNLARRADKFLVAVQTSVMCCWWFIDHSEQNECTPDPPIIALPPPVQPPS